MAPRVPMAALSREVPAEIVRRRLSGDAMGAEKGRGCPALQPGFPRDQQQDTERRPAPVKAAVRQSTWASVPSQPWLSVWLTTPPMCMTRGETSPESEEQRSHDRTAVGAVHRAAA